MKQIVFAIIASLTFCSCMSSKVIGLKGTYPVTPIIASSDKSFEKVWENVIDYFAQNGIPIRIIDKASGLIISDKAKLTFTFENTKTGKMNHPDHFVVLQQIISKWDDKPYIPESVTGEWNVRIKAVGDKTTINVNLYNIEATYGQYYYSTYSHTMIAPVKVEGKTTGVFEGIFSDAVK